jgi:hypothetical protein
VLVSWRILSRLAQPAVSSASASRPRASRMPVSHQVAAVVWSSIRVPIGQRFNQGYNRELRSAARERKAQRRWPHRGRDRETIAQRSFFALPNRRLARGLG